MSQAVMTPLEDRVRQAIRSIPDFPRTGILFRDYTPVLRDPKLLSDVIDWFVEQLKGQGVDYVVGIESRGFTLGTVLAQKMGIGFIPARKKGKLPGDVVQYHYDLEYGTDCIEMQRDSFLPGSRVVVVDDLLATGGTMAATIELTKRLGADVRGVLFLIELCELSGRNKLPEGTMVHTLVSY